MESKRGFFIVVTLDRFDELRRFLVSLFKFHQDYPVCILIAKDKIDAFRIKTKAALLTPFPLTVFMDTDIYINGKLDYLFEVAAKYKIGVVRHPRSKRLNSGVIAFPKCIMQKFSKKWTEKFDERVESEGLIEGEWDQTIFNELAPEMPIQELSTDYNATFHDISPWTEKQRWKDIKVFHFLHSWPTDKEKFKSYRLFMKL